MHPFNFKDTCKTYFAQFFYLVEYGFIDAEAFCFFFMEVHCKLCGESFSLLKVVYMFLKLKNKKEI